MVTVEIKTQWKCPYCGKLFDNRSLADSCAENCAEVDPVEEIETCLFICEMCEKSYKDAKKVIECENKHKLIEDKFWLKFKEQDNDKAKLIRAGNAPDQTKLNNSL